MWRISAFDRDGRQIASLEADRGEITIGRETDRRLVLPSPSVSRRHARLVLDGPQPYIVDEGSANGVLVNGVRINQPTAVVPGVRVDIADFYLEFDEVGAAQVRAPGSNYATHLSGQPSLRLIAEAGPIEGRVIELTTAEMVIGRSGETDIVVEDASLSRRHCRIRRAGPDRIELEDLNSSNGTWVNGQRITRLIVSIGDEVRFGELRFRIEGDYSPGFDEPPPEEPARKPVAMYAAIGGLALVLVAGVGFLALRGSKPTGPAPKERISQIAEQAGAHLKTGKDKLADRNFSGAVAEFEQVLEIDPANAEARKLKATAESEPLNDKTARQVGVKTGISNDRASLEDTLRLLGQVPPESVFHDGPAAKLAAKLVTFGQGQCKAKRFGDCQWALCTARLIAPANARPGADADAALKDAEKKLGKDKGFVPCTAK